MLIEGINEYRTSQGLIKYKFRRGRSDRKHLLVIFSGFRTQGTLDFGGAAIDSIQHNVLWLYDEFGDPAENSYYLMHGGEYSPARAVQEFIAEVCSWQGLALDDLTFAGFSKGGSAALYHGLRMKVGAIVVTVPQFAIGSYVHKNWKPVFDHMRAGEDPDRERAELDAVLPETLAESRYVSTHVYLFSSRADHQYSEEIVPNLNSLRRLRFFNFITTESPLITQHIDVTPYNVPGILALFQLCADKFYPYVGEISQSTETNRVLVQNQRAQRQGLAVLENMITREERIDFELTTLIRGIAQTHWGAVDRALLVEHPDGQVRLPLGKKMSAALSRKYLQDTYIDYSAAQSLSPRQAGYALTDFPQGRSTLRVQMTAKEENVSLVVPLVAARPRFFHAVAAGNLLLVSAGDQETTLVRQSISDMPATDTAIVAVDILTLHEKRLQVRGVFAPFGTVVRDWGDIIYYLVVQGEKTCLTYRLGLLDAATRVQQLGLPLSLRKAYFSDLAGEGVSLTELAAGSYSLYLLAINSEVSLKSQRIGGLTVDSAGTCSLLPCMP